MATSQNYTPAPAADFVLPFDLPKLSVRGRLVRLQEASARALSAHKLPEAPARVAGEALALAALLGSALKLDGRMTVQSKSDGPLDLITVDYYGAETLDAESGGAAETRHAGLRGFARLDETRFNALGEHKSEFARLVGAGALAITIEPRRGGQTYQGIVELSRDGLAASAETYFEQSEQLPTAMRLAAAPLYVAGSPEPRWRAGGIMLQATPERARDDDAWERLSLFLRTVEDVELVDDAVSPETLLWRLFHEEEVRVQPFAPLTFRCDCDGARIASVLSGYSSEERGGLADDDGIIRARCEFCGRVHEIAAAA